MWERLLQNVLLQECGCPQKHASKLAAGYEVARDGGEFHFYVAN
jgi:hypothetical protein